MENKHLLTLNYEYYWLLQQNGSHSNLAMSQSWCPLIPCNLFFFNTLLSCCKSFWVCCFVLSIYIFFWWIVFLNQNTDKAASCKTCAKGLWLVSSKKRQNILLVNGTYLPFPVLLYLWHSKQLTPQDSELHQCSVSSWGKHKCTHGIKLRWQARHIMQE